MAFLFKESYWSTLEALTVIKSLFKSTSFSTMFSRMKYPVSQATNASVCIQDWVSERVYQGVCSVYREHIHTRRSQCWLKSYKVSYLPHLINNPATTTLTFDLENFLFTLTIFLANFKMRKLSPEDMTEKWSRIAKLNQHYI